MSSVDHRWLGSSRNLRFFEHGQLAALHVVAELIAGGGPGYVCFCESNLLSVAARDSRVHSVLASADLLCPDGIAAVYLARAWGQAPMQRVSGPGFLLAACEFGIERQWRHFFYGGAPGVADRLAVRLSKQFSGLMVAGTCSPPFRELSAVEDAEIILRIEAARPDLVWVGLGGPRQELWMADHVGRLNAPVMLGVGAAFDFHSGNRRWAPAPVRHLGLEWAWRMVTGGKRVFSRNVRCVAETGRLLAVALLARAFGSGARRPSKAQSNVRRS